MLRRLALALLLAAALSPALYAQGTSADWRTITTAHFRVHYPAEYEPWAMRAATRLESVRDAVIREVGFNPPQIIDVVIMNPLAQANGAALPLLDAPRVILFAEPPGPEEQIGAHSHWIDLLTAHEITHTIHMLRPSRNTLERVEELFLPLNPITLHAPRWVLEGYATVLEGRLTGSGRPNSTQRAAILRKWAANGRMPSYAQLDSDNRFLGMSMAYLAGSAYLEWLEQRTGEGSLRKLWARMTAKQRRSFDTAFTGVFGEPPQKLYERFVADLTEQSVTLERAIAPSEGELWQETGRGSGDPAVSPDGTQLAIVLRQEREKPARLVIWPTTPDAEAQKKDRERIEKMLKRDPEDVAPVRTKPLPLEPKFTFVPRDGGDIQNPRWFRDGKSILYSHRQPDREENYHHDLFRWTPSTGKVERLTHLADVFDADPLPDGNRAIAIRSRYGATELVLVDLTTAVVTPLTTASIDVVYSHPRVSPDGTRVAYVAHKTGAWQLFVDPVNAPSREEGLPLLGDVSSPEWASNDTVVVTIAHRGFQEVHRVTMAGASTPLTRSIGGAVDPAPSPDGRIFFMSLEPDGFVVRVLPPNTPPAPPAALERTFVPALPPNPPKAVDFAAGPVSAPRAYGIGKQEWRYLLSTNFGPDQRATELGVRFGDLLPRLDTIVLASLGHDDAQRGFAVASAWRGWPVEVSMHLFRAKCRTSSPACPPGARDELESSSYTGAELRGSYTASAPLTRWNLDAGVLAADPDSLAFIDGYVSRRQPRPSWQAEEWIRLSAESGDDTHLRGIAHATFKMGSINVTAEVQHDRGGAINVGGLKSSIVPDSALGSRVFDPALPVGTLTSDRYNGRRIETVFSGITFFYQQHRVPRTRLAVAGAELATSLPPLGIVKFPGVEVTVGIARILDEPFRDQTNWWIGVRWRP